MKSIWSNDKLGNLVNFKTGKLNSNAAVPNGRYPFFTCSQETFRTDTCAFDTECVLLAGNNANGIYPLKYFKGKFDAYQRTYVVTPIDTSKLSTRFLYFAMRPMLEHMRSISTGAATKFLTLTILKGLEFRFPPLPTQQKIASILSAYDDLIENNTRRIAILEEMAQAIYREWFVSFRFPGYENAKFVESPLGQIPEGWEAGVLEDCVFLQRGFDITKANQIEGRYPVVSSSGLGSTHNQFKVEGPGVVIGRKGSLGTVFYIEEDHWPHDTTLWVKEFRRSTPLSAFFLLKSLDLARFDSGASNPTLNRNHIHSLPVAVPPLELLHLFDEHAVVLFQQLRCLIRKNDNLRSTRDLLLPKLISGQLDVENLEIDMPESVEELAEATA